MEKVLLWKDCLSNESVDGKTAIYYKENYGERDTDEWYINPKDNVWKFERNGKTIILECDIYTGEVCSTSVWP